MNRLPFTFDTPEDSPGFLLWQTTIIWQRRIRKALEEHDISHAQFVILATLLWHSAHGYDTTQIAIVEKTKLDKMTVSKSLKKLVELGLVVRMEHPTDTRAKNVLLTEKGKELLQTLVPLVEEIDRVFFNQIPKEEQKNLMHILSKLTIDTENMV